MSERRSLRVYFVTHGDGRLSGILLRRWEVFLDKPVPAAYGASEEEVLRQLEIEVQERVVEEGTLDRYLWDERFEVHRAAVNVFPQSSVKKQPVVGKKRIPLRLSYVACKLKSGAYRIMLPRFGWWLHVEDLEVAAEALKHVVSAALLGEQPRSIYDFRREGEEYVRVWEPALLEGATEKPSSGDESEELKELRAVAEELVDRAARRKLAPVIGGDPTLEALGDSLRRTPPLSLLLVGPSGCGKSTWVRRLARLFARWKREEPARSVPRIWRTSGERILAGMVYLGMWQERVFRLIEALRDEGDYLYVDRLTSIMAVQSDGGSIASLLAPSVIEEELSLIAECSEAELEHYSRRAPALLDSFTVIRLGETPAEEMPALLQQYQARRAPSLTLHPSGLPRLTRHLDAYLRSSAFPGKGFQFIDWLAGQEGAASGTLYPADLERWFARMTGLPTELIADEVSLPVAALTARLTERLVGQDAACLSCARVLARFKARLCDPERPLGALLFVGPTGVGKTELAKQVTRLMFGDEARMIRLDMSEFMSGASIGRLLEAGRGAGSLAERVRQQPLSLVLLDEIEKAHPAVFDLLLGVLGEGRLTDLLGRRVDFRMTLILMTSNLGVSEAAPIGFAGGGEGAAFLGEVRRHFRPEFFNRLDQVVPFRALSPADVVRIVDLELEKARQRAGLRRRSLQLVASEAARALLGRLGHHPTRGARPLKRLIEERVVTPLAVRLARDPSLAARRIVVLAEEDPARGALDATQLADAIVVHDRQG